MIFILNEKIGNRYLAKIHTTPPAQNVQGSCVTSKKILALTNQMAFKMTNSTSLLRSEKGFVLEQPCGA